MQTPTIETKNARGGFYLFAAALGLNLLVVVISLPLYQIPSGSEIRPMLWAVECAIISLIALCIVPIAIAYMIRRRRFRWTVLASLLGLTPWFLSGLLIQHAARIHQLILEP